MNQNKTYELSIYCSNDQNISQELIKNQVIAWLIDRGESTFVEGVIDNIDLDPSIEEDYDRYSELEKSTSPILIFKFCKKELINLQSAMNLEFNSLISSSINTLSTVKWQEGWKEGFRPFSTDGFYVCPPWESGGETSKFRLIIDPGMAFGTGQHATTRLCLDGLFRVINSWKSRQEYFNGKRVLDMGTGSGILAIAAAKLGIKNILGVDIDKNALIAAQENSKINDVMFNLCSGAEFSLFSEKFDLILANILLPVLEKMLLSLLNQLNEHGVLIVSGITVDQVDTLKSIVLSRFSRVRIEEHYCDDWAMLTFMI